MDILESFNPRPLAVTPTTVPVTTPHEPLTAQTAIQTIFAAQKSHRWRMATSTAAERVEKLKRFKAAIVRRQEELFDALHEDFSKPRVESAISELQPVLMEINHTIAHLNAWMKPRRAPSPITLIGTSSSVRYEAKGVVLLLSPWNYPFNLLMSPLVAAIAAGNCVMMRPSDKVKRTSQFMKSLIEEVFSQNEVALFTGPSSVSNALLELPFDHILFTGSTRIGKQIMAAASKHLTPVTLELGGQSPVIIDQTASVTEAAERIVWGKFLNAGQTCVAPNHVFIHRSLEREFIDAVKAIIARRYGSTEDKRAVSPDLARLVDTNTCHRLAKAIDESLAEGAVLECGGRSDADTRYLAPTVLSGVTTDMPIMAEELFGPVLPVIAFDDEDEVVADLRKRDKPLALYLFTKDIDRKEWWLANTTAGGTVVNNVIIHLGNPDLPFGGVGASGFGNYHGEYGFRTFSHERAVLTQGRFSAVKYFYPPYGAFVRRVVAALSWFVGR